MGKWKLVSKTKKQKKFTPADENAWELYDMDGDPSESINLALKYPDKVTTMATIWDKEAQRTMAKPWPWGSK
jgi:arylsulfatase